VPVYSVNGTDWIGMTAGEKTVSRNFSQGVYYIGFFPSCDTTSGCPTGDADVELSCYFFNNTASGLVPLYPQLIHNRRTAVFFLTPVNGLAYFWFVVEPQDLAEGQFTFFLSVALAVNQKSVTEVYLNRARNGWPTPSVKDYSFGIPGLEGDYLWEKQPLELGTYYGAARVVKVDDAVTEVNAGDKAGITFKAGFNSPPTSVSFRSLPTCVSVLLLIVALFL